MSISTAEPRKQRPLASSLPIGPRRRATGLPRGAARAPRCSVAAFAFLSFLGCLLPPPAFPSNGLNLIGFGAESVGMGGADLAVARDTTALNTNPAGLAKIEAGRLDIIGAYAYPMEVEHHDRFGNDVAVANRSAWLVSGGYASRLAAGPVTLGIGLFGQGGTGNVYENLATPFGTTDDLSSLLRLCKAAPGLAWAVSDALSLGASLQLVYADMKQKVFPETSFVDPAHPSRSFFGLETSRLSGFGFGAKIGAQYRIGSFATIGAAYTSRMPVDLDHGDLTVNMSAVGLGKVVYRDASVEGISLPQEIGVGIAVRPAKTLLVAVEVNWLDWSRSMRSSELRATDPDNPAAPPVVETTATHDWSDQYVFALGLAWDATEDLVLRAGYNYGKNPIPSRTMSPLLAAHAEHHITLGGGYRLGVHWRTDAALEYDLLNRVTYDNPETPFGPGAEEVGECLAFHLMLSREW